VAALRIALQEVATRDFVRGELRDLLTELERARPASPGDAALDTPAPESRRRPPESDPDGFPLAEMPDAVPPPPAPPPPGET
jgi:hypothetical protein